MTAPPSPGFSSHRPLLLGFLTLSVLGAGLFGWGAFASISGAVIASGQVEVGTGDQVVEHIDGGTVGEILARDGARVVAGEVLIRLKDAALRTEETILRGEGVELAARRNRLDVEFGGAGPIAWDDDLAELANSDASAQEVLDGQQRLFEARHSSWAGQVAQLRERIGQTRRHTYGRPSARRGRPCDLVPILFQRCMEIMDSARPDGRDKRYPAASSRSCALEKRHSAHVFMSTSWGSYVARQIQSIYHVAIWAILGSVGSGQLRTSLQ